MPKLSPTAFFNKYKWYAMITQIINGVPASITLSQAAIESGWGGSGLSVNANNFFGIKADKSWNGDVYSAVTGEFYGGQEVNVVAPFRAYDSPLQSFRDHAIFLRENPRYSGLFELSKTDYIGWAKGLQSSGYATSPSYANDIISVIEKYNLNKYDLNANAIKYTVIITGIGAIIYVIIKIVENN